MRCLKRYRGPRDLPRTHRPIECLTNMRASGGSQYCSDAYQARLGELGFLASMSGKGNCYDNAVVETFFKTIKSELIWRTVFMSRSQAETEPPQVYRRAFGSNIRLLFHVRFKVS